MRGSFSHHIWLCFVFLNKSLLLRKKRRSGSVSKFPLRNQTQSPYIHLKTAHYMEPFEVADVLTSISIRFQNEQNHLGGIFYTLHFFFLFCNSLPNNDAESRFHVQCHLHTFPLKSFKKFESKQPLQQRVQLARFPWNILFQINNLWFRLSVRHLSVVNECDYWTESCKYHKLKPVRNICTFSQLLANLPQGGICCNICFCPSPAFHGVFQLCG